MENGDWFYLVIDWGGVRLRFGSWPGVVGVEGGCFWLRWCTLVLGVLFTLELLVPGFVVSVIWCSSVRWMVWLHDWGGCIGCEGLVDLRPCVLVGAVLVGAAVGSVNGSGGGWCG